MIDLGLTHNSLMWSFKPQSENKRCNNTCEKYLLTRCLELPQNAPLFNFDLIVTLASHTGCDTSYYAGDAFRLWRSRNARRETLRIVVLDEKRREEVQKLVSLVYTLCEVS